MKKSQTAAAVEVHKERATYYWMKSWPWKCGLQGGYHDISMLIVYYEGEKKQQA